ncbi:MAG: hypothetical protein IJZ68_07900 [Bacteroidaceae bacterium]|nr:hypothetical protein [Bacteroidaceae bacterium]
MQYPFHGDYHDQIRAIASWCDDRDTLQSILSAGHADYHCAGTTPPRMSIDECVNFVYTHDQWTSVLSTPSTIDAQVNRVANEGHASSHFTNKETLMATLSIALMSGAHALNEWCSKDNTIGKMFRDYSYRGIDTSSYKLRMTIDTGAYIGAGIMPDGSERATTAVTLVFARIPSYPDGNKIPFSITTMYPDITGETGVGSLVHTGRNYAEKLAEAINHSSVGVRMYWLGQHCGYECSLVQGRVTTALFPYTYREGNMTLQCSFGYNERSMHSGNIFVQDPSGKMVPLSQLNLPREIVLKLRDEESKVFAPLLAKAQDTQNVIFPQSHLFTHAAEEQIYEDGAQMQAVELDDNMR